MAAAGPIRLPNGQLVRQPGSNGGVHRGPDLSIRRNVMEGLFMRAMIREGVLIVVDAKGKRRHRAKVPMAMAENFVTRLQLIVLKGSDANLIRLGGGGQRHLQASEERRERPRRPVPGHLPQATAIRASGREGGAGPAHGAGHIDRAGRPGVRGRIARARATKNSHWRVSAPHQLRWARSS